MRPEEIFRNRLKEMLSNYYPNEECVDVLSSYLFTMVMEALANSDLDKFDKDGIQEFVYSYEGLSTISPMDETYLKRLLRDIAVFVSQNIMIETLKGVFSSVKNFTPLVPRELHPKTVPNADIPLPTTKLGYSANEMDFEEIDLEAIPKVEVRKNNIISNKNSSNESNKNEFIGDFEMDFEEINRGVKRKSLHNIQSIDSNDGIEENISIDDSDMVSEEIGTEVPKVSIDLDY